MVINASAAATLLEQRPEKIQRDSNPRPLRCWCFALPSELSKPHESSRIWVSPLYVDMILGPSIAKISVTSPIVIDMPTRELLAGETKSPFV